MCTRERRREREREGEREEGVVEGGCVLMKHRLPQLSGRQTSTFIHS